MTERVITVTESKYIGQCSHSRVSLLLFGFTVTYVMLIESTLTDAKINYYEKYTILRMVLFLSCVLFSSDIDDLSDHEMPNITLPITEDSQDNSDLANDSDESMASKYYDKEWQLVAVGVENGNPVCVKLNDLIQRGKVSKNQILYSYLNRCH